MNYKIEVIGNKIIIDDEIFVGLSEIPKTFNDISKNWHFKISQKSETIKPDFTDQFKNTYGNYAIKIRQNLNTRIGWEEINFTIELYTSRFVKEDFIYGNSFNGVGSIKIPYDDNQPDYKKIFAFYKTFYKVDKKNEQKLLIPSLNIGGLCLVVDAKYFPLSNKFLIMKTIIPEFYQNTIIKLIKKNEEEIKNYLKSKCEKFEEKYLVL